MGNEAKGVGRSQIVKDFLSRAREPGTIQNEYRNPFWISFPSIPRQARTAKQYSGAGQTENTWITLVHFHRTGICWTPVVGWDQILQAAMLWLKKKQKQWMGQMGRGVCVCVHWCVIESVCVSVYTCAFLCICEYMSLCVSAWVRMHCCMTECVCVSSCVYLWIYFSVSVCLYVYMCVCVFTCMCVFVCISVSGNVCFCVCLSMSVYVSLCICVRVCGLWSSCRLGAPS